MVEHPCSQIEKISKIEQSVALTNNDINYMKLEISEIKTDVKDIGKKMDTFIDSVDKKYATKEEFKGISDDVKALKGNINSARIERVKTYGGWIAAIIGGLFTLLAIKFDK